MSPRVVPKKTWEGALASMIASVGLGMLLYNYALPIGTALLNARLLKKRTACSRWRERGAWPIILLSAVMPNVAAQLG